MDTTLILLSVVAVIAIFFVSKFFGGKAEAKKPAPVAVKKEEKKPKAKGFIFYEIFKSN